MNKYTVDDDFLYEHMKNAESKWLDSLPKEEELSHEFSKSFEKSMNKLLKQEKRTPFMRSFVIYGKKGAAILLIVLGISFVTTISVEAYRVKFFEIIKEVYEEFTSIRFSSEDGITDTILEPIGPDYIPEGFSILEEQTNDYSNTIIYENASNDEIIYDQKLMANGEIIFDTEGITVQTMEINNQVINYFTNKGVTQAYWNDDLYFFTLHSTIGEEEILKMVKSVLRKQ